MRTLILQASTGDELGYIFATGIGLLFLIALIGALKPLFRRFTGQSENLKQQKELIELQRQQLEELKKQQKKP